MIEGTCVRHIVLLYRDRLPNLWVKCLHVTKVLRDGWLWWKDLIDALDHCWKGYVTGFELRHFDVRADLICVD